MADDSDRLARRLERERTARKEAERLLEEKSLDLYRANQALQAEGEQLQLLIRQLQQAQAQLLQSEKMASIGQLAAGVAHEINNPIGFVNSNVGTLTIYVDTLFTLIDGYQTAMAELADYPKIAPRIAQIRQSADIEFMQTDIHELLQESQKGLRRVKDIVQSLKDFSHAGEAVWEVADLHRGLDATLNMVNNEIKYKASVVKQYGEIPLIRCLASQLNQVFTNLLVNAAHAIPQGDLLRGVKQTGVITVGTGYEHDWVWIEISDTGAGISGENLKRIFDPFFTTKPIGQGTGLGLSIAYGIVAKHGGRIEVESTEGKGTSFTVRLPVNPPARVPGDTVPAGHKADATPQSGVQGVQSCRLYRSARSLGR